MKNVKKQIFTRSSLLETWMKRMRGEPANLDATGKPLLNGGSGGGLRCMDVTMLVACQEEYSFRQ